MPLPEWHPKAQPNGRKLTKRQAEICELVSEGLRNLEISERLFISDETVKRHIADSFAKIGCETRAGLAGRWAAAMADESGFKEELEEARAELVLLRAERDSLHLRCLTQQKKLTALLSMDGIAA